MRVSIKEISGKTGYSLATVSNVLNGKAGVNAETAKQIMKIGIFIADSNGGYPVPASRGGAV